MGKLFRLFKATKTFLWIVALEEITLHKDIFPFSRNNSVKYRLVNGHKRMSFFRFIKANAKGNLNRKYLCYFIYLMFLNCILCSTQLLNKTFLGFLCEQICIDCKFFIKTIGNLFITNE